VEDRGVGSWIERRCRVSPHRPAIVHGTETWTYAELADRIQRLASAWREMGVRPNDRVVWRGPNHPAFLESLFAAAKLGAALAPINHRLNDDVTEELVARYAPALIVEHDVQPIKGPSGVLARVRVGEPTGDELGFEDQLRNEPAMAVDDAVDLGSVCLLVHTSGTTGRPRGVMLTHANVTANAVNMLSMADLRSDDVTIAIAPLFRSGGTGVNVLPVMFKGGAVAIPVTTEPDELLRLIERDRVTIGFGNPDLLDALVRAPGWPTADLSSARCFLTGGALVPERLIRTFQDRGIPLLQGYGLSEAAPVVLLLDGARALEKVGSAGTPPLFVDVRTTRRDGSLCDAGETGELQVRGPNVMAGYWSDEEATLRAFDGEWLRTGDAARIDADGDVWIVDRMGDAFEVAGHLVYPGEVERVLLEHPAVREAGVSTAGAFVVVEADATVEAAELLARCRDRLDAREVPKLIRFVESLPRSSVGKLLRQELR
jgi:fatty-acyl-CoA synthase